MEGLRDLGDMEGLRDLGDMEGLRDLEGLWDREGREEDRRAC